MGNFLGPRDGGDCYSFGQSFAGKLSYQEQLSGKPGICLKLEQRLKHSHNAVSVASHFFDDALGFDKLRVGAYPSLWPVGFLFINGR